MAEPEKKQISFLKRAAMQVAAGGSAGFVEVCIMQPLDVVKTRLQLQSKPPAATAASGSAASKVIYQKFENTIYSPTPPIMISSRFITKGYLTVS